MNTEDEISRIKIKVLKGKEDDFRLAFNDLHNTWIRKFLIKNPYHAYNTLIYLMSFLPELEDLNLDEILNSFDHKERLKAIREYIKNKEKEEKCEIKDLDKLFIIIDKYFSFIFMGQISFTTPPLRNSVIKTFYKGIEHLFGVSMNTQNKQELVGYICYLYDLIPFENNENPSDGALQDRVRSVLNENSKSENLILEYELEEFLNIINA